MGLEVSRGQCWNLDARAPSQGRRAKTGKQAGDLPVLMCLLTGGFQAESSCLNLAENENPLGERTGRTKFRPSQREGAGSRNFWDSGAQTEPWACVFFFFFSFKEN